MLSLFVFDMLQAVGGILDVKWAHDGIVTTGHYCTAQGNLRQIGQVGVALITLIITIHAFVVAISAAQQNEQAVRVARLLAFGVVFLASLFVALWAIIGNMKYPNYETPTPDWCWISPEYTHERLAGEYVWLWIALGASTVVYIPLYFWARSRSQLRAALRMLLYPLAYALMIIPLSVSRWLEFENSNRKVPSAATYFAATLFNLSGAINVLLFLIFRSPLLLFSPPEAQWEV
jgi:hypothetical protein